MTGWSKARYLDYFFSFSIMRAKLTAFRVCFFTLVGLDGILQLPHAARYGAGDFNVGHFVWLESILPAPERSVMVLIFLLQAYLGVRIALGTAVRSSLWLLTGLYGYAYFASQLDSYQHHYLVFLLLLLCCFVPWERPAADSAKQKSTGNKKPSTEERVESAALRVILVQVGIVYLFAALTKCESLWLDGTVLGKQLPAGLTRDVAEWLGMGSAAVAVLLVEAFLAVALISGRLLSVALVAGVGLHAGIEFGAEFKIGIFSYYMFAFYLLLVPDRLLRAALRVTDRLEPLRSVLGRMVRSRAILGLCAPVALIGGFLSAQTIPMTESTWFAIIATALALGAVAACLNPRSSAPAELRTARATIVLTVHLVACMAIPFMPDTDERIGDYYKYWAGSARRLNRWDEAGAAYARLVELRPDWAPAHYYLGRIAHKDGRIDDALGHYERAQEANRDDYRGFLQAALIHHGAGRGQEALTAAQHARTLLQTMPATQNTRRALQQAGLLIQQWSGRVQPGS